DSPEFAPRLFPCMRFNPPFTRENPDWGSFVRTNPRAVMGIKMFRSPALYPRSLSAVKGDKCRQKWSRSTGKIYGEKYYETLSRLPHGIIIFCCSYVAGARAFRPHRSRRLR